MRVISQDGRTDIPYENFVFGITKDNSIVAIRDTIARPSEIAHGVVATYSTEEKAKKAMEELRYAYMCHSLFKMGQTPPGGIDEKLTMGLSGVFQFQAEEELE